MDIFTSYILTQADGKFPSGFRKYDENRENALLKAKYTFEYEGLREQAKSTTQSYRAYARQMQELEQNETLETTMVSSLRVHVFSLYFSYFISIYTIVILRKII